MGESEAIAPRSAGTAPDAIGRRFGGLVSTLAVVAAAGAVVSMALYGHANETVLLGFLAAFAVFGIFFLFALAAGHVVVTDCIAPGEFAKAMVEGLDTAVLMTDREGNALYGNAALRATFGIDWTGGLGALENAFDGEPNAAAALFRLMRAAEDENGRQEEFSLPAAFDDATPRWVRVAVRSVAIPGRERDLERVVLWQLTDITAERRNAAAVQQLVDARLDTHDRAPVGLLMLDVDGIIGNVNTTFADWLGVPADVIAAAGLRLVDLVGPAEAAALEGFIHSADAPGASVPATGDFDLIRADGHALPVRFFATVISNSGARQLSIAAVARERAPELYRGSGLSEERFSRFFQSAPFGIATLAADGAIVSWNETFARMVVTGNLPLPATAAEALCKSGDPELTASVEAGLAQVLAGHGDVAPVEITAGDQKEFTRRVYMSPLSRAQSAPEVAILFVIDATEQKQLEAKFAQSQKMEAVGQLAGGIAHDFNNVLTAIMGFSDLLLQTHRPGDAAYTHIRHIRSSADKAAGIVSKLLAFSRRQTQQMEVLQLGEVVTENSQILKTSLGEKIQLKIHTERDLWYVRADKTQFDQIVINLVVNARDAMPNGGTLTIRTRNVSERESQKLNYIGFTSGEYVLVEVSDTGVGIKPDDLTRIFEPFFTTKSVGQGTGLGLATVYGIVKQTGGYIFPESTPGVGTTFRVFLPRYEVESDEEFITQKSSRKEAVPADLTGTGRVLLVEDEDAVRNFAVVALKRQGYEVLEASDGIEALEVMEANEGRIDIVVSDVVMPEMDGPTLLKKLREKNPDLKIIFVSGYPNEAFRQTIDENEQFAFLGKPFSLPQLAAKVKEELAR
jgi:two-component system cell cycle sensor histidine kinase/response regulator CckA